MPSSIGETLASFCFRFVSKTATRCISTKNYLPLDLSPNRTFRMTSQILGRRKEYSRLFPNSTKNHTAGDTGVVLDILIFWPKPTPELKPNSVTILSLWWHRKFLDANFVFDTKSKIPVYRRSSVDYSGLLTILSSGAVIDEDIK